ncbi:MAG: hypothetical protein ACJAUP_002636, partial [Cellvibrionaceae bacterium]
MKFAAKKIDLASLKTDCLVVAAFSDSTLSASAKQAQELF